MIQRAWVLDISPPVAVGCDRQFIFRNQIVTSWHLASASRCSVTLGAISPRYVALFFRRDAGRPGFFLVRAGR